MVNSSASLFVNRKVKRHKAFWFSSWKDQYDATVNFTTYQEVFLWVDILGLFSHLSYFVLSPVPFKTLEIDCFNKKSVRKVFKKSCFRTENFIQVGTCCQPATSATKFASNFV